MVDPAAFPKVHVPQRFGDIEQATAMDVDAPAAEEAAEDQQVIEEVRHRRGVSRARRTLRDGVIEQFHRPGPTQ
jgi:hypothetical protein